MRIAILCNGRTLAKWQRRAINLIERNHEIFLLVADHTSSRRKLIRHGLYYALNLATIRNSETRAVPFPDAKVLLHGNHQFVPIMEGAWAALPDETVRWLQVQRIDAIIKFGLGLLRLPDGFRVPVLSYHHGDPRAYRGRPAGFYEVLNGERYLGQIVQLLSNRIDAGEVLALSQTRAVPHSYRETLMQAYALSPNLLPRALDALECGDRELVEPSGRNYGLPTNLLVAKFLGTLAVRFIRHLAYGAFVEKKWRVSWCECDPVSGPIAALEDCRVRSSAWSTPAVVRPYTFYADPFPVHRSIAVEAMNGRTGAGELVLLGGDSLKPLAGLAGHASYPAPIAENGQLYLIPEIVDWAQPKIFLLKNGSLSSVADLDIDERAIVDPTPLRHYDRVYLFGNRPSECPDVLRLWSADSIFGRFEEHPDSPIRTSVRGSRMAGLVSRWPQGLIRFGQDYRRGYGDGVVAFHISELTLKRYKEEELGGIAFDRVRGPHTVNLDGSRLVFDWYNEHFSMLAGVRRVLNRFSRTK